MKKAILKTILGGVLALSLHSGASAQLRVNINIGSQPAWGPTGYNHVDYYYLPDIESYYDVSTGQYIYQDNGRWVFSRTLPSRYLGYDLYSGYKVVVNRPKPYLNYAKDRVTYSKYRNWRGTHQPMLRESRNNGNHYGNNGNRPGNNNINRGHDNMNHGGMSRPNNMNQGGNNNMNHGNMNHGEQPNQMQHGQAGRQQQWQNHSQGQGNQLNGGDNHGHDDHGHDDHGHH